MLPSCALHQPCAGAFLQQKLAGWQLHAVSARCEAVRTGERQAVHAGDALHVGNPPAAQPHQPAKLRGGGDGDAGAGAVEQQEVGLMLQYHRHCSSGSTGGWASGKAGAA